MAIKGATASDQGYKPPLYKRVLSISEIGVLVAVLVFFGAFTLANNTMAAPANLALMALQGSFLGLAAFGMSFLMIAGEIDLSSGATAGLAAAVAGLLLANGGWPEWASYAAALAVAMGVGLFNSFVVLKIRMPSFFATLGSSFMVWGLAIWLLKGQWIYVGEMIPLLKNVLTPSPLFSLSYAFWPCWRPTWSATCSCARRAWDPS